MEVQSANHIELTKIIYFNNAALRVNNYSEKVGFIRLIKNI